MPTPGDLPGARRARCLALRLTRAVIPKGLVGVDLLLDGKTPLYVRRSDS